MKSNDFQGINRRAKDANVAKNVSQLRPGQVLFFEVAAGRTVKKMLLYRKDGGVLAFTKDQDGYALTKSTVETDKYKAVSFRVKNSLYADGRSHGLKSGQVLELATIFTKHSPLNVKSLRLGARVTVYLDGVNPTLDKNGTIVGVDYTDKKQVWSATRYKFGTQEAFFDPSGMQLLHFNKYPLEKFRVSSGFSLNRMHPVLKQRRPHYGVDLATSHGSPVHVTANGVVAFIGAKGGYGRTVIIDHGMHYQTIYAHLSGYKKNMKLGDKVSQSQVIGYVGSSGTATGPHLHYEVRHHGKPQDPMRWSVSAKDHMQTVLLPMFKKYHEKIRMSVHLNKHLSKK